MKGINISNVKCSFASAKKQQQMLKYPWAEHILVSLSDLWQKGYFRFVFQTNV